MYIPERTWHRRVVFTFAEANWNPWKGSIVFKILISSVYLSILKRSIWNSILTGLVPCAREKCCKEEPGKPLGPRFLFFWDNLKGRVSATDSTLRLHFMECSCCQPQWAAGDSASVLDFDQREGTSRSREKLEHHILKTLFLFQTSLVTRLGFVLKCGFTNPTSSQSSHMLG